MTVLFSLILALSPSFSCPSPLIPAQAGIHKQSLESYDYHSNALSRVFPERHFQVAGTSPSGGIFYQLSDQRDTQLPIAG